MHATRWALAAGVVVLCGATARGDVVDDALAGRIGGGACAEAAAALEAHTLANPGDDRALFALGLVRALRGFEILAQGAHRYGATNTTGRLAGPVLPIARIVPMNPDPQEVTLADLRRAVAEAMDQARLADGALARVDGGFDLRADVLALRMDLDGDGAAGEAETILALLDAGDLLPRPEAPGGGDPEPMRALHVDFDRGDAEWLRGYCHLTMAAGEFALAHDATELFERAGHVLFPRNVTPHAHLKGERSPFANERQYIGIEPLDAIAAVHLMSFPVRDPAGLERARAHLLEATVHSRAMWEHYDAETDDRDEWVPNPDQSAAFPRAVVDREMRGVWVRFIDQAQALLQGEVLLPFWRGDGTQGVNVRRVFTEPTTFDPILWFQGSAATPYLEQGRTLDTGIWADMERVFNERTFRHMFWFN